MRPIAMLAPTAGLGGRGHAAERRRATTACPRMPPHSTELLPTCAPESDRSADDRSMCWRKSRPAASTGAALRNANSASCRAARPASAWSRCRPDRNDGTPRRIAVSTSMRTGSVSPLSRVFSLPAPIQRADDDDQKVAVFQLFLNMFAKVDTERNVVDIHEHGLKAVVRPEPIEYAARNGAGIGTSIDTTIFGISVGLGRRPRPRYLRPRHPPTVIALELDPISGAVISASKDRRADRPHPGAAQCPQRSWTCLGPPT